MSRTLSPEQLEIAVDAFDANVGKGFRACLSAAIDAALASLSHTMGVKVKELEWTEPAEANQECRYNHVKAQGLEEYRIEWKGWKDFDAPVVYHGDDFVAAANDLDDAKVVAKADYQKRVDKVLSHLIPSALTPTQQPVGWIPWTGSEFMPVTGETSVWIQSRSGNIEGPALAREWAGEDSCWKHTGGDGDIVAYSTADPALASPLAYDKAMAALEANT